jgi:hypothetical protein
MGVTDRWVRKLLGKLKQAGDSVVVHGLRGQPSNRRIAEAVRQKAVRILQQPEWHDFGPAFRQRAVGQAAWHRGEQRDDGFYDADLAPGDYPMQVTIGGAASNQPLLTVSP